MKTLTALTMIIMVFIACGQDKSTSPAPVIEVEGLVIGDCYRFEINADTIAIGRLKWVEPDSANGWRWLEFGLEDQYGDLRIYRQECEQ